MSPSLKKKLIFTVKIAIILAVVGWVGWELYKSWSKIHLLAWNPNYFWLAVSGVFYGIGYIPACLFWYYSMRQLGQHPGLYETFRAYFIGHLGKYVPGKAMVVVIRSGLLDHDKTRASVAAAAVFLETLTMMAVGAFLSALIIGIGYRFHPQNRGLLLIALAMMIVSVLPILPPVFRYFTRKLGVGRHDPEIDQKMRGLNLQTLLVGWGMMCIAWLFLGLSLWASVRGIGIETGPLAEHLPRFVLAAALSVVLGFVLMIPGGIGVREVAMAQVLTIYFVHLLVQGGMPVQEAENLAPLQAIVVAGVQRGISIIAELFVSAVMWKRGRRQTEIS